MYYKTLNANSLPQKQLRHAEGQEVTFESSLPKLDCWCERRPSSTGLKEAIDKLTKLMSYQKYVGMGNPDSKMRQNSATFTLIKRR